MKWSILGLAAGILTAAASSAIAQPLHSTTYSYYLVGGASAQDIYSAMLHKGPRVRGAKAYAATSATTTQDGKLRQDGACKVENYKLKLDFVIKLPKLRNEKRLPAADKGRWQQFASFLNLAQLRRRSGSAGQVAEGPDLRRCRQEGPISVEQDARFVRQETRGF
jgi:predicted secreted Zn-dependent protease